MEDVGHNPRDVLREYLLYYGVWEQMKVVARRAYKAGAWFAQSSQVKRMMVGGFDRLLSLVTATAVACALFGVTVGQEQGPVSELCLGCICEAASNCNRSLGCSGDVCGLFRITWAYWADAGKPVIAQDNPGAEGAYARCATEPFCAASTVQGYMRRFGKDCNGDGTVNCFDYAAIHRLGGYGCSGALDYNYQNKFMNCQRQVQQLTGRK